MRDKKKLEQLEDMEFREITNTAILLFCFVAIFIIKGYMEIIYIMIPTFLLYMVIRMIILIVLFCKRTDF